MPDEPRIIHTTLKFNLDCKIVFGTDYKAYAKYCLGLVGEDNEGKYCTYPLSMHEYNDLTCALPTMQSLWLAHHTVEC